MTTLRTPSASGGSAPSAPQCTQKGSRGSDGCPQAGHVVSPAPAGMGPARASPARPAPREGAAGRWALPGGRHQNLTRGSPGGAVIVSVTFPLRSLTLDATHGGGTGHFQPVLQLGSRPT